jgi:fibronectin type III domain protein
MARHPDWTPSMIKSAMMTSAIDTVSSAGNPFAQGAGFVHPNGAADPGLVYPTSNNEYRQYLVGLGIHFSPPFDTLTPITGSELNQASIAVGSLPGTLTVDRHVKNVTGHSATFNAAASVPGFDVTVSPSTLTLAAGEEASFTVTFSRTDAAFDVYAKGSLTWTDGTHDVRSPIALRPVGVAAPAEVHADISADGSKSFSVTPGFTGDLSNTIDGLVGVTPTADSVAIGAFDATNPTVDADTKEYDVVVPAGTVAARFSLDAVNNSDDLDLYVYRNGARVGTSASGAADEQVTLMNPAAGTYKVYVNGFAGVGTYLISNFVLPAGDAANASVTPNPASVTQGVPTTLNANWSGLDTSKRWFGVIHYTGTSSFTLFSVG